MNDFRRWFLAASVLLLSSGLADGQTQYLISTYAGGLPGLTSAAATSYSFQNSNGIATDRFGNLYVSSSLSCVFRLDPNGYLTRVVGTCEPGFSGDGGNAVNAQLNNPQGVALDAAGNLYIADGNNQRIRRVTPNGIITSVAGTGTAGYSGDNGPATSAQLSSPRGIAVDTDGNLCIADEGNNVIRRVGTDGSILTIAGTGVAGSSGDGGLAAKATLTGPLGLTVDSAGYLYIADRSNQVRKVSPGGTITHVAGTGAYAYSGDGGPASAAALNVPSGLAMDSAGNLYIADQSNQRIRKIDGNAIITTYAGGNGIGNSGDGGPATSAQLNDPVGVAVNYSGTLYIADQSFRVRAVNAAGIIGTAAGDGVFPFSGDGGPAGLAQFGGVWGLTGDGAGNLYAADWKNNRVRMITPAGIISTFAGNGLYADTGDGGPATSASVTPFVVAADSLGNIYLADAAVVRKVAIDGTISTVAGTGTSGFSGDGGPATQATLRFYLPGLAVDSNQNVYISDWLNQRVRKVTPGVGGIISTVAGTGVPGYSGDNGPGTSAQLNYPAGLAVDAQGNLYIADYVNCRVRKLTPGGTISTVAGNGTCSNTGDAGAATNAAITNPWGLAVDLAGNLYITTQGNTVREVTQAGIIGTIAGTGVAAFSGDGGPAAAAQLDYPLGIFAGSAGNIYVADFNNDAVRVLQPLGTEPVLEVSSTHSGIFAAGQTATYSLTVTNATGAAPTSEGVTVTDTLPAGLSLVSISGDGWNCSGTVCTNTETLNGGSGLEPISVVVNVPVGAPPQFTNQVTVSGGGALSTSSSDAAFVGVPTPSLEISLTHGGDFLLDQQGTYTITVANQAEAAASSGTVTITDTLPNGLTLMSMTGMGWSCTGSTCTRSDPLGGGASYNPITVTVNVAANASSPVLNQAMVSGGGSANASATDSTTIVTLACAVTGDAPVSAADVQKTINEALGAIPPANDLNQDGAANVVDVQIAINAALGLGCVL